MFPIHPKQKIEVQGDIILANDVPTYQLKKDYYGEDYAGPRWSVWKNGRMILEVDMRCEIPEILKYENNLEYQEWIRGYVDQITRGDKIAAIREFRLDSVAYDNAEFVWRLGKSLHVDIPEDDIELGQIDGKEYCRWGEQIGLKFAKLLYEGLEEVVRKTKDLS